MMKNITIANLDNVKRIVSNGDGMEQIKMPVVMGPTADQCNVNFFELGPGKGNTSNVYHYHAVSEEVFYIISGQGYVRTPDGNKVVKAGDIIVCPAHPESAHNLYNALDTEKLVFMNVATAQKPDIMFKPDTNNGYVFAKDEILTFSRENSNQKDLPPAGGGTCS